MDTDSVRAFAGWGSTPYWLILDEATPFSTLFESALNFVGAYCVWKSGKITVRPYGSDAPAGQAAVTFTDDNKAQHLTARQAAQFQIDPDRTRSTVASEGMINRVTLRYQRMIGGDFKRQETINSLASQSAYIQVKAVKIDAWGIYEDLNGLPSGTISAWHQGMVAGALSYLSRPLTIVERSYDFQLETQFSPGDRAGITDNSIVNPTTGARGVTSMPCWVLAKSFDWRTGVGKVKLAMLRGDTSRWGLWAPSARVDKTAANGGLSGGSTTLTCWPNEYTHSSQAVDVSWFPATGTAHIVALSPSAPAAPTEWYRAISSISAASNTITFASAVTSPNWDATLDYVVELDDILVQPAAVLAANTFHADDADDSTGKTSNDYYTWGGPSDPVTSPWSGAADYTTLYRKPRDADDNEGEPLSVHKWHDLADFGNTALSYVTPPTYINDLRATSALVAVTSGSATLCYGPAFVPAPTFWRPLDVQVLGKSSVGGTTATFVIRASSALVRGSSSSVLTYVDGGVSSATLTTVSSTLGFTGTATLTLGARDMAGVPGAWVTVEEYASGTATASFGGLRLMERLS